MSVDNIIEEYNNLKANSTMKYMDWEKAKQICLEHPDCSIWAGLRGDMGNTGGQIYDHGKWEHGYVYDRSWLATPILEIYTDDCSCDEDILEIPCWTYAPHENTGLPEWWGQD